MKAPQMMKLSKKMLKRRERGREGKDRRKRRNLGRWCMSPAPFIPKKNREKRTVICLPHILHEQSNSPCKSIMLIFVLLLAPLYINRKKGNYRLPSANKK